MTEREVRARAIALYDRYTHEGLDRRAMMERMARLVGSVAAAEVLVAAIAADPAAAALTDPGDKRLVITKGPLGFGSPLSGYVAAKKGLRRAGVVLVIHENRGLTTHIEDVTRRLALAGFFAIAPDMLSPVGGTPANEDKAREEIGKLDLAAAVASVVELIGGVKNLDHSNGKVGVIGFCWGGAFVHRLAVAAGERLDAGVSYYGPAPDPSEAAKVRAPLMIHLAGLDERVARTAYPWIEALRAAHKPVAYFGYDGVNHAFNNDTSAERYDKKAADLAWARTIRFFRTHLG